MITLKPELKINSGANRACYLHPDDPGRCIKIENRQGRSRKHQSNQIESAYHSKLAQRLGETFYQHAPRGYGMVETDLGPGLCFEMIRDMDGQPSMRLASYIKQTRCTPEHALGLIDQLYAFVCEHRLGLFDVNPYNLLVRRERDQQQRLVVIDWKGPEALREFIPAARFIPYFARLKKKRRFQRLRGRVREMAGHQIDASCNETD